MNNVNLIGRLTRDPELKYTQSGQAFTRFNLAVDRFVKDGEKQADFINCVAWGKTAEAIVNYSGKGLRLGIQGRIQTGSYKKDNGDTVYTTDVIVNSTDIIDWKNSNNDQSNDFGMDFEPTADDRIPF